MPSVIQCMRAITYIGLELEFTITLVRLYHLYQSARYCQLRNFAHNKDQDCPPPLLTVATSLILHFKGAQFNWSNHGKVLILSHMDWFLLSIDCKEHFQGIHQVILFKVAHNHFPILLCTEAAIGGERPSHIWEHVLSGGRFSWFCQISLKRTGYLRHTQLHLSQKS